MINDQKIIDLHYYILFVYEHTLNFSLVNFLLGLNVNVNQILCLANLLMAFFFSHTYSLIQCQYFINLHQYFHVFHFTVSKALYRPNIFLMNQYININRRLNRIIISYISVELIINVARDMKCLYKL